MDLRSLLSLGTLERDPEVPNVTAEKAQSVSATTARKALEVEAAKHTKAQQLGLDPRKVASANLLDELRHQGRAGFQRAYDQQLNARMDERLAEAPRTPEELIQDTQVDLVRGTTNLVGGTLSATQAAILDNPANPIGAPLELIRRGVAGETAANVVREADRRTTEALVGTTGAVDDALGGALSDVAQINEQRVAQLNALEAADHAAEAERTIADGGSPLVAKAKRLGKDLLSGADNTLSNPTVLFDTSVSQIPSLTIGMGARGAVTAEQVAARAGLLREAALARGLKAGADEAALAAVPAREALLAEASEQLATRNLMLGTGLSEGGSAYQGTADEILSTPIETLAEQYPDWAERLRTDINPGAVRAELAREAGARAGVLQGVAAGAASRIAAGFELHPTGAAGVTGVRRAGSALADVGKEGVEELLQSGSGELAGNLAMASESRDGDLLDGVGIAAGQGLAGGLGMAGPLQAPAVVRGAVETGVDAVTDAAQPVLDLLDARAQRAQAAEQVQVDEQREAAAQTRRDTLGTVDTAVRSAALEQAPTAQALVEPLENEPLLAPELRDTLQADGPVTSRVDALNRTVEAMRTLSAQPEDQRDAGTSLGLMLFTLKTARQLREHLDTLDPESGEAQAIQRSLLMPEVTEIEEALPNLIQPETLSGMLEAIQAAPDFASPKSQQAAEQIAVLSEVAPDQVSSEAARSVALYQRLAPSQKAHLETVAAMADIREQHEAAYQRIGPTGQKTPSIVTTEVTEKGMSEGRPSLAEFQRRIMTAMAKGDTATASKHMRALQHFARHYGNKTKAFDAAMAQSRETGKRVELPYEMVDGAGKKIGGKAYAWFEKEASQHLVEHIFNDGNTVAEMYNGLAAAYPQLIAVNQNARTPLVASVTVPGEPQFRSATAESANAPVAPAARPVESAPAAATEVEPAAAVAGETAAAVAPAPEVNDELAKILAEAQAALAAGPRETVTAEDTRTLDDALALSEDDYLAAVNPEGKALTQADLDTLTAMDGIDLPESAQLHGSIRDKNGTELQLFRDLEGDRYVVENGKAIATIFRDGNSTLNYVLPEAQGRNIGQAAMVDYLREFPFAPSGGFSKQGAQARLRALRTLKAEREQGPAAVPTIERFASVPGFMAAYQLREGAQSLLARVPNAVQSLSIALKRAMEGDVAPLRALFLAQDQQHDLNEAQLTGLDTLVNKIVPEVIRQLNANLLRSIGEGKRFDPESGAWVARTGAKASGWLEDFVDGKQDAGVAQFSAAALERGRDENGQPYVRYQADIAQAMALASLHWVLKQVNAPIKFDAEDLAALYPDGIPPRLKQAYETMHFAVQPARTIANDLVRMLGMQGKTDVSVTLTDGIAKSLALDALTALHDADVLAIRTVEGTQANKHLTFLDLKGAKGHDHMLTMRQQIGSRVLQRLLDPESQELPTFAPVTRVPNTVSGTGQKLSARQKEQVRKENAVKVYRNPNLLVFADRLGDRWLQLLGKDPADLTGLHPDHARSIAGVNDGLDYALERSRELDLLVHEQGGDANETALYWSHYVVSNGRVMQNGFGGQGDKQARELFSANRVTADLSSDRTPLAKPYYLSLAQALGLKTEKLKNAEAVRQIQERLGGAAYQALFTDIQALLRGEDNAEAVYEQLATLLGRPTSAKAIHALVTHARLLEARANGTAGEFTTYLGFELDGKTNGPINALMHFGLLKKSVLGLLKKGGLFVDEVEPRTLSDVPEQGDLYSDVASETEVRIGEALGRRTSGSREANMLRAGLRMLTLAGHVKLAEDGHSVGITRDMAKAGMVPTTYGSGARGVANQMAHDVMAGLVKHLSDVARGEAALDESVVKSVRYIMSERWDNQLKSFVSVTPPDFSRGPAAVKFNEQHFQALVDNLVGGQRISSEERVAPGASGIMREAIEDQLQPVMDTFKLVFKASRLQMLRFQQAYQAKYDALRTKKIADGTLDKFHALSRADEDAIRNELRPLMPAYPLAMTGGAAEGEGIFAGDKDYNGQFLVTNEKGVTRNYQAESLVGGMRLDLNVRQYLSPGVKAAPLLTIGGGDATMMHLLADELPGTLNVFDGWEVGIDALHAKALAANQAVLASWQHDLLGPVADSLRDLDPAQAVDTAFDLKALGETVGVFQHRRENERDFGKRVFAALVELQTELQERATLIARNKQILFTQHKIAVDQMSGGENPATIGYDDAIASPAASPEVVSEPLDVPAPIAGESAALVARLGVDYQNGLAELDHFQLQALLSQFPFTDKVRQFVVTRISHLLPDDVRVFIGTPARIQAKQEELFPGEDLGEGLVPGVTYRGVAFLTVPSEETLVHELVHLATLHLVQRGIAGAKGLTAAQKDAVRELQSMLTPFLGLPAQSEALRSAQHEVQLQLDAGQPALAINEMLAWSLANSTIASQLTATEAPGVLKRVAKTIRALVRKLLGLPNNTVVETFLDQLGSNFQRLTRRPRLAETHTELATFQRLAGPADHQHARHLEDMYRRFGTLLAQLRVRNVPQALQGAAAQGEREALLLRAEQELAQLEASHLGLSDREAHLFRMVHATLGSNLALDPAVLTEFDKLYAHALEKLDESAFLEGTGPVEEQLARTRWNAVFSDARKRTDLHGRSVLLTNFIALALSHAGLRAALQQLAPPTPEAKGETFDDRLRDWASRSFDWLGDRAMGVGTPGNQRTHLDRLAVRLGQLHTQAVQQAMRVEQGTLVDRLEGKLKDGLDRLDSAAEQVTRRQGLNAFVRQSVQFGRGLLSDEQAGANAEATQSIANQPKIPQVVVDLVSELAGNTPSTVRLHRLVNLTRHAVSRVRQQLREEAPGDVRSFFKTALSPETWAQLHRTVGQVDLQALGSLGIAKLARVVTDPVQRQAEIDALIAQLGVHQGLYEAEAKTLARAIVRKDVAPRYRNAEAMAALFGQAQVAPKQAKRVAGLLDRLVSLYALEHLSQDERTGLGQLLSNEAEGMQKLLNTMRTLVSGESRKGEQRQRYNRWKGWLPQSVDPRSQVVLANSKQAVDLVKRGYKRIGFYQKDALDPANDLAYYAINWVGGQATFNQGALQTVEGTLSGVDALTGQSLDPGVGTLIVNEGVVSSIAGRHRGAADRLLTPIYDQHGEVTAYERVLDPAVVAAHTGGQKDLALSIGIWLGRQAEENLADAMNGQVVQALKQRWEADRGTRSNEFVSLNRSTDPVLADTWKAIPRHTQDMLTKAFGDQVMIRRDMVRNAVGYRSASIADAFSGVTTLPEPARKAIVTAVYALPGIDYKKIVAAEKALQGAVGTAKDWIVVRSGVVAIANGVANLFQLTASGINPLQLPKLIARKAQETEIYLRNEKRLSRIRVELAAIKRPDERNKLLLEQQRLLDAQSRLSIAPLVFAGELPTIAEGLSEHDEYTLTGDLSKWIEKQSERLPAGVLTAAKIVNISKDTALYQGMNRLVQFGDFTAKAVLFDKWISEGMSQEEALSKISERFVNYNLNAGRTRDYLESIGLLWFWNYKLRVQKIVLATLRENPLRFLLAMSGAHLAGSDSLLTSAAPFVYWDYSIGPDQMFRAPEATLWHQLFR